MKATETVRDRARGLMEGIAVGNQLGIAQEGWPQDLIAECYPEGIIDIHARFGYPDDDDLAQAIIVAEAALEGTLDVDDLMGRFWKWGEVNGVGMGGLTGDVLSLFGGAYPQKLARRRRAGCPRSPSGVSAAEASRQAWEGGRAGNGALMRCAPLALRWAGDASALVRESVLSAVPTHWDRRCGWSCVLANLAAAAALRGETLSPKELLKQAERGMTDALPEIEQYGYGAKVPHSVRKAVKTASESTLSDIQFDGWSRGFTLLTLQAVLIAFWTAEDFESGLSEVIEAGGDTDTNGAAVGAILGARFGAKGIPKRWLEQMRDIRAARISLERLADELLNA